MSPRAPSAGPPRLSGMERLIIELLVEEGEQYGLQLVDAAAGSGLVNAVCFNLRYFPLNQQMAAMVRSGASPRGPIGTRSACQRAKMR